MSGEFIPSIFCDSFFISVPGLLIASKLLLKLLNGKIMLMSIYLINCFFRWQDCFTRQLPVLYILWTTLQVTSLASKRDRWHDIGKASECL